MQNKNFYREFNLPPKPKHDWETLVGGIMVGIVILAFSLLSYGFWDSLFQMFQEVTMELSKETIEKLWATTDAVSDGQIKKTNRANDQLERKKS